MNPIKSLHIDNVAVSMTSFMVPSMSLSSSRSSMHEHKFVFTAPLSELAEVLAPAYSALVTELRWDDNLCGGQQDELAVAGYPTLDELQDNQDLLKLVIGVYLLDEFLGKFTWDGKSAVEYWFDRVTGCRVTDGMVFLSGACYSR